MNEPDPIAAAMIRNGVVGLANYAASDLLESPPDLKEALATSAFATWQGVLRSCVEELAASAVTGNQQDIGLLLVADFFEMDGGRVIQLGSDMPMPDLAQAVEFYEPDLLALSVSP